MSDTTGASKQCGYCGRTFYQMETTIERLRAELVDCLKCVDEWTATALVRMKERDEALKKLNRTESHCKETITRLRAQLAYACPKCSYHPWQEVDDEADT